LDTDVLEIEEKIMTDDPRINSTVYNFNNDSIDIKLKSSLNHTEDIKKELNKTL